MSDIKKKTETKKKSSKNSTKIELVKKLAKSLLKQLGIEAKIKISPRDEEIIYVQLETQEPGGLIGYHGETLASFQLILAMMTYRQSGEWTRILVNVNDYRERRQESLERMAFSSAQRVKFSGETQILPPMPPAERRVIHLALADDQEVMTESEGEGQNRRVLIKPKAK